MNKKLIKKNKENNFYDYLNEDNEENSNEINNFQISSKKLGRKKKFEKDDVSKTHTKLKKDNRTNKIMKNFLKFVVNFLNDYANKMGKNKKFKLKRIKKEQYFNVSSIKKTMNFTIKEFCEKEICSNSKYFKLPLSEINQIISNFKKDFLDLYLFEFYQRFFLSKKFNDIQKEYSLNEDTKNLYVYLEKFNKELKYKNLLQEIGENLIKFIDKHSQKLILFDPQSVLDYYDMLDPIDDKNDEQDTNNTYGICDSDEFLFSSSENKYL